MARYYFLINALPPLTFGSPPEISFKELQEMVSTELTVSDLALFQTLLTPIDLYNVKAFWLGMPLDDRGTLLGKDLEEALLVRDGIPSYLVDFLGEYESVESRLAHFPSLYASFYRQEFSGFLSKYFKFERELRLVLTALRAKKGMRNLVKELQFEDPLDPFVAQILAQKDAPDYTPPTDFEDVKVLFVENNGDPRRLSLALLKYRFEKIGLYEENEYFTVDRILAYGAKLLLLEEMQLKSREKAIMTVEELSHYG